MWLIASWIVIILIRSITLNEKLLRNKASIKSGHVQICRGCRFGVKLASPTETPEELELFNVEGSAKCWENETRGISQSGGKAFVFHQADQT
jgi:hypothetical protein